MKKTLFSLALLFVIISTSSAKSTYFVDDSAIETLLDSSEEINPFTNSLEMASFMKADATLADKSPWIAIVLDFFLGGLAIHRVYLGGSAVLVVGYFFTFGGIFGILPFGDFIALLINNGDISKYVDSDAFIMW